MARFSASMLCWIRRGILFVSRFFFQWPLANPPSDCQNSRRKKLSSSGPVLKLIMPKVLCKPHYGNSHLEMIVWKQGTPIRGFLKSFFSNFRSHIRDSQWGRKCIFINGTSCNGSLQQIQFQFANGKLPHSRCRAFWAIFDWNSLT